MEGFTEMFYSVGNQTMNIPVGYTPTFYEQKWLDLFEGRNETLVFGIIAFVSHFAVYYIASLPYMIADCIPALHKYKIQPKKEISKQDWWHCVWSLIVSQVIVQLPMMMMFFPSAKMMGFSTELPFPNWAKIMAQIFFFFVIEDLYHYWAHRLFHYGILYRKIHKVHHEYTAPFGLTAEYAHPLETIILGQGTIGGPLLYTYIVEPVHVITMLLWIAARLFQTVEAHSGYDFPWSMSRWNPLWAGAIHHDYHHYAFMDNFASTFTWWDSLFGTDSRFRRYKSQLRSQKQE